MPDNLTRRKPEDSTKININQDWEVRYWCKSIEVSETVLRKALEVVDPMVADVKAWHKKNRY